MVKKFNISKSYVFVGGIKYNINERRPYSNSKNKDSGANHIDSGFNKKSSISKNNIKN